MQRKIMEYLKNWKNSEHRKPLILQGARQVGKTYSILEFGRNYYENVVYFNFESNPKLISTFEEDISPKYLIPILSHIAGQTIIKEKTLIIFRDSFGSSIIPFFVPYYSKIVVIDLRYIDLSLIEEKINYDNCDILYLYSTLIVNSSNILKVNVK